MYAAPRLPDYDPREFSVRGYYADPTEEDPSKFYRFVSCEAWLDKHGCPLFRLLNASQC